MFLVLVAQDGLQHFVRISKQSSHSSHAMFSTLFDPPFTAPTQSTSTSSSQPLPSNWTPSAAPLWSPFSEPSPRTHSAHSQQIHVAQTSPSFTGSSGASLWTSGSAAHDRFARAGPLLNCTRNQFLTVSRRRPRAGCPWCLSMSAVFFFSGSP